MVTGLKTLGVISARAGSRGVVGKNLRPLGDMPLMAHLITAARQATLLDRLVVSTEDDEIAGVARTYGAETPFTRPAALAADLIPLVAVTKHAMEAMDALGYRPDIVVQLSPTCPFIRPTTIDKAIALVSQDGIDSAVTLQRIEHEHPYRAKELSSDGTFESFLKDVDVEQFQSRQELPELYCTSGAIYARRRHLLDQWSGHGFAFGRISKGVVLDEIEAINIDRPIDFLFAEFINARHTRQAVVEHAAAKNPRR